jgi:hypothetical protein
MKKKSDSGVRGKKMSLIIVVSMRTEAVRVCEMIDGSKESRFECGKFVCFSNRCIMARTFLECGCISLFMVHIQKIHWVLWVPHE